MTPYEQNLVDQGLARFYMGRLIPVIKGGDGQAESPFPAAPEDFSVLDADALNEFIDNSLAAIEEVGAAPQSFVNEERTSAALLEEMEGAVENVEAAREALAVLTAAAEPVEPVEPAVEDVPDDDAFAALATRAAEEPEEPADPDDPEDPEPEPEAAIAEPVVAAAPPARRRPARPARSRASQPTETAQPQIALTAAAGAVGVEEGAEFRDEIEIAEAMSRRKGQFGNIPEGTRGEKVSIARADWRDQYPPERQLGMDEVANLALVAAATSREVIRSEFEKRKEGKSLVASGGLCAPVTPYYGLAMISQAMRPVRAALASFNADRGGIRYARPAALSAITTGVGSITAAQDLAGGSSGSKTCQVVDCPPFQETDVEAIFHCLQFGNLGARTFPERVAQWNNLTLAAHARLAETHLLNGIGAASTAVTAGDLGLGASSALLGQILAAVNGMRSRHRMDPEAVLRILLPDWSIDLLVSDVIRGQFERFDTNEDRLVAFMRTLDVEPSFYIDGASGAAQVFGTQNAGALLPFPATVVWYLYAEGTFLYLDGGVLELGLVRDSILNKTNDFQIFGETFENVAFTGVESLKVTSTLSDTGAVSTPVTATHPVVY